MPLMRSDDVEHSVNDHKLWWGDVVRLDDGTFQIITYAQLFSNLKPGELRTYRQNKRFAFEGPAIRALQAKYEQKERTRGYYKMKDREGQFDNITASNEEIIEFLKKYG